MSNKNIVLCSDGTGNKGGYGSDSNVYKTYKAVDVTSGKAHQFTFYDQGVGTDKSDTSKNKYWTAMSGAFGFGFQKNVLHLYHFLARCYVPGDNIFLFGFSRGAATVRAFAGFLNACGLIDPKHFLKTDGSIDSAVLSGLVKQAMTCYGTGNPNQHQQFKKQFAFQDPNHAPDGNLKIHFVGVWDTVSALGFPKDFSVLLQGFGRSMDWLTDHSPWWKHSFYDYKLNNAIQNAYHAISIDDDRETFHPLVWDERDYDHYVEQVWFAGVHSNVGGGYPRTGMSDVALVWMLEKAMAHGLVIYDDVLASYRDGANIYDKLYDSRDGLAMYYRYGPRNLAELSKDSKTGKWLLKNDADIAIHRSAFRKILEVSEAYAPDGLPPKFNVVDHVFDANNPPAAAASKVVLTVDTSAKSAAWQQLSAEADAVINARKHLYVWFSELTMAIILASWFMWVYPPDSVTNLTSGGLSGEISDLLRYLTPVFFENFIRYVVEVHGWISLLMLGTLAALYYRRNSLLNKLDQTCQDMATLIKLILTAQKNSAQP
ncbi:hypothetical protein BJL95_02170 [Methylomonas sp. LWB]|uniref:DUF2235 domain-containing protein n=1 Tax=Methylomonas sp. LWB TaxID=1905845 RepID=UPI0008DA84BB|nr:DUF2235 domain-containing protein [Methylomonas sp. LWB]OHX36705.1 hypothetical protein BJL95_02170 [Methylomonas sp. LWB]